MQGAIQAFTPCMPALKTLFTENIEGSAAVLRPSNSKITFFICYAIIIQACLPNLKKPPSGASILLFSTVAVTTGMPFHGSIAGAKGAVEGLTRSLAADLAPRIRVNAIAPSLTETPLAAGLLCSEEKRQAAAERHPMKSIGSAQDIARLALFLLSDDAGWITGQVFHADGGYERAKDFQIAIVF
jgi:NAD(P)-dependent dehydrogenase (short-subunit alcohol dehydrogenase family)